MCSGPLLRKILLFTIPLSLSGILQLLFNAADVIVIGRYAGSQALGAVGATGPLVNLIVNTFLGLSVGTSSTVANYCGARDEEGIHESVHTAITVSLICGVLVMLLGICFASPILRLMDTPEDIIDLSSLYLRIYFGGIIGTIVYNFGASILRAMGDTRRPLIYLLISGIINVLLNLLFVIRFHMSVAGVALATVISQIISAIFVLRALCKMDGCFKLQFKMLRIYSRCFHNMMRIGVPAGIQSAFFGLSNTLIQSSVNSFGSVAVAGNAASLNLEGFIYTAMNSFHHTAIAFLGQNVGAKKYERINRIVLACLGLVTLTGALLGILYVIFAAQLVGIYSPDPEVISFGIIRLVLFGYTYFICGQMDVMAGALRGLGHSVTPMITSLLGACGFRIFWIYTFFAAHRTLFILYISYPVSWVLTLSANLIAFFIVKKKLMARMHEVSKQVS